MTHLPPRDSTIGSQRLTHLAHHQMKRLPMPISQTFACWSKMRAQCSPNLAPSRDAFEPRNMADALRYAFVLDRARPGSIRLRVAGQSLYELMGMETRGMPLRAFFDLSDRRVLMEALEQVFERSQILDLHLKGGWGSESLTARMLILPMRDHTGTTSKALGALVVKGPQQATPQRFVIGSQLLVPLHDVALDGRAPKDPSTVYHPATHAQYAKAKVAQTLVQGFAETQMPFGQKKGPQKIATLKETHVSFLRVVETQP